jgi:HlyD family secretion protein
MKRSFFLLILVVALAGIVSAVLLVKRIGQQTPRMEPAGVPPTSPFEKAIGARGIIESIDENIRVAPTLAGLVAEVPVAVGKDVKKGDILVRQDTREAEAMIATQRAEIEASKALLRESEVSLADKRDTWARMEKLIAGKVASDEEKQRALFAAQTAEAQIGSIKAKTAGAEALLERLVVQRDLLTTRAPRDGRVLQVNTRAGEYADNKSADPMILLGQVDQFQLRADVDEDNASDVRENTKAVAFIKGRRDVEIPLKFVRIEPYILPKKSLTGESGERVDTRVLQIIFRFDQPDKNKAILYVGQQMDVFLERKK